jgi:hypothetical protein
MTTATTSAVAAPILATRPSASWRSVPFLVVNQSLTIIAKINRYSFRTKSGVHPGTGIPGVPVLPPGGVTPPGPDQYGTLVWRYPASHRKVISSLGM